ncbi:MAG: sensor histidine kinase [Stellaceae bacterium]
MRIQQALRKPTVADVFITDELGRRAPKKTDYLQEKLALQDLAARMADQPEEVLPRFVDLALEMTGGVSAGLSLYEENPAPGVFRWQYLRGVLAPFNGATTPRDFSPCGITLDRNAPVLSRHPERVYSWIADANIIIPEVLLVPLYLGGGVPLGTLWIVSDREEHFDSGHARAMTELAAFVGIALRMVRSEQRLHQALDEQETLAREMSHRVNNLFVVTEGMIRISAKDAVTTYELAENLSGRLHAFARAHALVRASFSPYGSAPQGSELADMIRTIGEPHEAAEDGNRRFSIDGPPIRCGERATNGIALIFHELATNAVKYGALKCEEGHIDIHWQHEDAILTLRWIERGGPPIERPPATKNFGSTLVQNTVTRLFNGTLEYNWLREGMAATITIPIERLSA